MTVAVQPVYSSTIATGSSAVFTYPFKIVQENDLKVYLDGVLQTSGYTVSGVGYGAGGDVTFSVAPAIGVVVLLELDPVLSRDTDYQQYGPFPAPIVNADFDRMWKTFQKFANDFKRSLKLPTDTGTDQVVNFTAGERANALLSFDASGNLTITPITSIAVSVSAGSFTVDTFSGDGVTTGFTLSRDPGIKNNTTVFVDGVYVQKSAYSITGTTLTFTSAPASGTANVEVTQSVALTAGAPADGTVTVASLADAALAATTQGLAKMADGFLAASAAARAKMADKFLTLAKMADMATGKVLGNVSGVTGTPAEVDIAQTFPQIQPVSASVAANALTLGLNPTRLDFRSSTLTAGTTNTRHVASAISLVVPDTATLGTVNAVSSRLALLAIDNAGTVELAVVNIAGGNNLDETTLISTTAITTGADSANVIYSTTARTNVPFRVVGFIDITEATAGTWATAPSLVQGAGGNAAGAMMSLGYGQTWQDVKTTPGRAAGTTYYNTTGRPIAVSVNTSTSGTIELKVNGVRVSYSPTNSSASGIVPPGASYSITTAQVIDSWTELR